MLPRGRPACLVYYLKFNSQNNSDPHANSDEPMVLCISRLITVRVPQAHLTRGALTLLCFYYTVKPLQARLIVAKPKFYDCANCTGS